MKNISQFDRKNQPTEFYDLDFPRRLFEDLCRIQAAQAVPLDISILDVLAQFPADLWDFETSSFRKNKWDSEKSRNRKPRGTRGFQSFKK